MNTKNRFKTSIQTITFLTGILFAMSSEAWVAHGGGYYHGGGDAYYHGGGGYYHGGYGYGYHGSSWGWGAPGVVIGVPAGAYYGYGGCSLIQQCYPGRGCVNQRVCR